MLHESQYLVGSCIASVSPSAASDGLKDLMSTQRVVEGPSASGSDLSGVGGNLCRLRGKI